MSAILTVRMDDAVKEQGTAVMKRCGYTPSVAVRRLFEYAVKHDDLPFEGNSRLSAQEKRRRIAAFDACRTKRPLTLTDEQIKEGRLDERYGLGA